MRDHPQVMRRLLPLLAGAWLAWSPAGVASAADTVEANGLRLVKLGDYDEPVYATSAPGDPRRVFVVQKGFSGKAEIRVVRGGVKLATPFLALRDIATVAEQGLLSLAFAPDYATSGRFYVYYTDLSACGPGASDGCDVRIDEYRRADADHAAPATRRHVLTIRHRDSQLHNGGTIVFGPDGLLYAGPGDGGTTGDPECDAQRADSLLGKIIRLDPMRTAAPQIVARGMRNPYRFSFDHATGDLLIGDVGESDVEEVDFLAAGRPPDANLGWNMLEGDRPFSSACGSGLPLGYVAPAITYRHPAYAAAVTGGVVVRDLSVAPLLGRYVYADFYAGEIRSAIVGAGGASGDGPTGLQVEQLTSFGQGGDCRVYVTSLAGAVYRLEAISPAAPPTCQVTPGPGAGALPPDRTPPVVRRLRVVPTRFRVAAASTPGLARNVSPAGTVFRFRLSEAAAVSLRFERASRRGAWRTKGRLVRRRMTAGAQRIRFTGRIGLRALPTGRYRATLRARDSAGNVSARHAVRFSIVY